MATTSLARIFFDTGSDPTNRGDWSKFLFDLNNQCDVFSAAATAINASIGNHITSSNLFLASGTWTSPAIINGCLMLLVGGGAGGSSGGGGLGGNGGGAGQVLLSFPTPVISYNYSVTVGAGGASDAGGSPTSVGALASASGGSVSAIALQCDVDGFGTYRIINGGNASGSGSYDGTGLPGLSSPYSNGGNGGSTILGIGGTGTTSTGNSAAANTGAGGGGGYGAGFPGGSGGSGLVFILCW